MRKERLTHFRKKLEEKHRQLVDEVGRNVLYGKGPEDDSIKDLGDQASSAYNREFQFELGNGDRRLLKEVASALQKLDDGNFGACERCGETIASLRRFGGCFKAALSVRKTIRNAAHARCMSMPASPDPGGPIAAFFERHETVRLVLEWIVDRFADHPEVDDSIDWEDGEEHEEPGGPAAL